MPTPTPAPAAPVRQNPQWWRTLFATFVLSIFLRAALGVPFLSTFLAVGIIYLMHVLMTELGTGFNNAVSWVRRAGNIALGVAIFLALRFLAAKVLGLYPVDTYTTLDDSGGLYWVLGGKNISSWILWEVMFAFVAGKLVVLWARGQDKWVGAIFVTSLIILSVQIAWPEVINALPKRKSVATAIVEEVSAHGIVGGGARGAWVVAFGPGKAKPTATTTPSVSPSGTEITDHIEGVTPVEIELFQTYGYTWVWKAEIKDGKEEPLRTKFPTGEVIDYGDGNCHPGPPAPGVGRFSYTFTDPRDEANGHVKFRIDRVPNALIPASCK
jgi:hypothetical protein